MSERDRRPARQRRHAVTTGLLALSVAALATVGTAPPAAARADAVLSSSSGLSTSSAVTAVAFSADGTLLAERDDAVLEVLLDLVLMAGVCVDDVPAKHLLYRFLTRSVTVILWRTGRADGRRKGTAVGRRLTEGWLEACSGLTRE